MCPDLLQKQQGDGKQPPCEESMDVFLNFEPLYHENEGVIIG